MSSPPVKGWRLLFLFCFVVVIDSLAFLFISRLNVLLTRQIYITTTATGWLTLDGAAAFLVYVICVCMQATRNGNTNDV